MKAQFIKPMLATLTKKVFSDPTWIYERKLDGIRCIVVISEKKVTLYSRNHKVMNASFPEVVAAFEKQKLQNCVLDGEIVALLKSQDKFSLLQNRMHVKSLSEESKKIRVKIFIFDVLINDGEDLRKKALHERKLHLKKLIKKDPFIEYLPHKKEKGIEYFELAKKRHWEGLIGKKAESFYVSRRGVSWLKFKCSKRQEFVIMGYTVPSGSRKGFGALLIGYYERGKLKFAGKVGTGFNEELLGSLSHKMKALALKKIPSHYPQIPSVIWIKPQLVCEVTFTEWTKDKKLRHPSFMGLRKDKDARFVMQEKVG